MFLVRAIARRLALAALFVFALSFSVGSDAPTRRHLPPINDTVADLSVLGPA